MASGKKKKQLAAFEGSDVIQTAISVKNAGDGLSSAMSIDNEELHIGETVHVVLECEVSNIGFDKIKDVDGLVRKQTLKAGRATLVDGKLVADVLDSMSARLEQAAGITKLFDGNGNPTDPGEPTS